MGIFKITGIFLVIIIALSLFLHFSSQQKDLKEMFIANANDAYFDVIQRMYRQIKHRDPKSEEVRKLRKKMQNPNDRQSILEHFQETKDENEGIETIGEMLQGNEHLSNQDIIKELFKTHLLREPSKREMRTFINILEEEDGNPERIIIKIKRTKEYRNLNDNSVDSSPSPSNTTQKYARVMPHPDDSKKKRKKYTDIMNTVSKEEKANIYQDIVQIYDSIMRRLPTMFELDYYASKFIDRKSQKTPFDMDELRRILQSSKEYRMLVNTQTNVVNSEMPLNISEQQLSHEVREIYDRTRNKNPDLHFINNAFSIDRKVSAKNKDSDNIDASFFQFLKDKYVEYELDDLKLENLITFFLQFETKMQKKENAENAENKKEFEEKKENMWGFFDVDDLIPDGLLNMQEKNGPNKDNLDNTKNTKNTKNKGKNTAEKQNATKRTKNNLQNDVIDEEDENPLSLDDVDIPITAQMMSAKNARPVQTMDNATTIHQPSMRKDPFSRLHECLSLNYSRQNAIAHMQNERNKAELQLLLDRQKKLTKQEQEKMNTIMHRQYKPAMFESGEDGQYGAAPLDEAFDEGRMITTFT